jgi:hypothetical protein
VSEREQCRDLREWHTIGTVSTSNGMLAIVAPYYAHPLADWWDKQLERLERQRRDAEPRQLREFEEIKLEQVTSSVMKPDGYADSEQAFAFATDGNGLWDVEARMCDQYGEGHLQVCEIRLRLHHFDEELDDEPRLTPLASKFGTLLKFALEDWCELGRFKGRRLDDVLFHEYEPARDGDFSGFVLNAMYADWQPDGPLHGQPFPQHRNIQWPLLVIQAAIHTRDPELVAAILAEEARYELKDDTGWVDEDGNEVERPPEHELAALAWPSEWRRVFGLAGGGAD